MARTGPCPDGAHVSPSQGAVSPQGARVRGGGGFARLAAIGALVLVALAIVVLLLSSGGNSNHYRLLFETGGQLVKGNQVLIGGAPVGSVDDVKLTDNGQAQVDISVNRPLHEGTTAIIRATSLSGIANRYISIQPGPDSNPELQATRSSRRSTPPARSTSISSSTPSAAPSARRSGTSSRARPPSTPARARRRTRPTST